MQQIQQCISTLPVFFYVVLFTLFSVTYHYLLPLLLLEFLPLGTTLFFNVYFYIYQSYLIFILCVCMKVFNSVDYVLLYLFFCTQRFLRSLMYSLSATSISSILSSTEPVTHLLSPLSPDVQISHFVTIWNYSSHLEIFERLSLRYIAMSRTVPYKAHRSWLKWLKHVTLATWKIKVGVSEFKASPGKNCERSISQ
jgi:hypothetical protein